MAPVKDWGEMRERIAKQLLRQTGRAVESWSREIRAERFSGEPALRSWLSKRGVTGYPQMLLVHETFGYPDFLTKSADELLDGQYADRPSLRPVYDAIIAAAEELPGVSVQARKTYVALLTERRTFARIQATTRTRIDMGLRLDGATKKGRLVESKVHDSMPLGLSFETVDDLDANARRWIAKAHADSQ